MPRKKKKGIAMPPLEFIHSPLYQDAPMVSYDFGNSNTATAKTVCVDELENFPWVSPQFRNRPTTRVSRPRKSAKTFTRLRSKSEGSPLPDLADIKSKFRPLQFVRRSLSSPQGSRMRNKATSKSPDTCFSLLKSPQYNENISEHDQSHGTPCPEEFEMLQGDILNVKTPNVVSGGTEGYAIQTDFALHSSSAGNSFHTRLAYETNDAQDGFSNDVSLKHSEEVHGSVTVERQSQNCERPKSHFPRQCIARNLSFSQCPQHEERNGSVQVDAKTHNDISNRWDLCTPPLSSTSHVKILVADTPECDYGLSMRQRQLKNM